MKYITRENLVSTKIIFIFDFADYFNIGDTLSPEELKKGDGKCQTSETL